MADDRQHHRARPLARGRRAQGKGGPDAQGLGRSSGGLSTKVHAATDAFATPVRLLSGPGQRQDVTRSHALISGLKPGAVIADKGAVIADKGYDADPLRQAIRDAGAEPVIPARSNRTEPRPHDKVLYKERNLVERFFSKLKQCLVPE